MNDMEAMRSSNDGSARSVEVSAVSCRVAANDGGPYPVDTLPAAYDQQTDPGPPRGGIVGALCNVHEVVRPITKALPCRTTISCASRVLQHHWSSAFCPSSRLVLKLLCLYSAGSTDCMSVHSASASRIPSGTSSLHAHTELSVKHIEASTRTSHEALHDLTPLLSCLRCGSFSAPRSEWWWASPSACRGRALNGGSGSECSGTARH